MRLLVDMDAVIAHWGDWFDTWLDTYREAAANIPRTKDQQQWDLNHGRTADEKRIIKEIMTAPGFYRNIKPIPGAKQALKAALKAGHDVRIVSSPYISNPTCASDKIDWIVRHYGSRWASRLVLTNDKTVVRGDFLIDDKPEITGAMEPTWEHVVFGDYAYNRHVPGLRISAWSEHSIPTLEVYA
jgi:5'-nucleotidase